MIFPERENDDGTGDIPVVFKVDSVSNNTMRRCIYRLMLRADFRNCLKQHGSLPNISLEKTIAREAIIRNQGTDLED